MPVSPIPTKEIHDLIKSCKRLGVSSIKVDSLGLEVVFSENKEPHVYKNKVKTDPNIQKQLSNDTFREREFRLSQLDIEDPHLFEQIILNNSEKEFLGADTENIGS